MLWATVNVNLAMQKRDQMAWYYFLLGLDSQIIRLA
jgi:hypothetical protein